MKYQTNQTRYLNCFIFCDNVLAQKTRFEIFASFGRSEESIVDLVLHNIIIQYLIMMLLTDYIVEEYVE